MHAEMTVGLDLSCLENLKIYNGYEKIKKERKPPLDDQSSQDDNDSDAGPPRDRKNKCGRPANPIPRHKRDSHIKAEYKRRDKIQKGFDSLISLVPELGESTSSRESKSVMLQKTAEYCRRLKTESGDIQNEMWALRAELEALGTDIHNLQEQLPQHGVETVDKQKKRQMDDLYDEYVQEQTRRNWKFWLFGFFMRPLYQSYRVATSKPQSYIDFNNTINNWVQETLSLTSLRRAFLEALRKISTRTKIMSCPEQIQEEAMANVGAHCIIPKLEAMAAVSPNPRHPPSPKTLTPAPSPTPTPPRTPTSSRKSGRRESRKSTESRSRSNTPPGGENRPKRRPSYRSEKRGLAKASVSDANDQHISRKFSLTNSQASSSDLTYIPKTVVEMLPSPPAQASPSPGATQVSLTSCTSTSVPGSASQKLLELLVNSSSTTLVSLAQQKPAVTCSAPSQPPFIYIPFNMPELKNVPAVVTEMQVVSESREVAAQATTQPSFLSTSSNFLMSSPSLPSTTSLGQKLAQTQPFVFSTQAMDIDNAQINLTASTSNSFLPISQSGTIANGSILPLQSNGHTTYNQYTTLSASVVPMETSLDNCDTDSLLQSLSMFSTATSPASNVLDKSCDQSVISSAEGSVGDTNCLVPVDLHEEDSLMKMLTMDVMDVNSLMTFLDDMKTNNPHTSQSENL